VTSILIAVAVAILTFGSGLVGLYLQKRRHCQSKFYTAS
jgi:hypothetical protein